MQLRTLLGYRMALLEPIKRLFFLGLSSNTIKVLSCLTAGGWLTASGAGGDDLREGGSGPGTGKRLGP